MGWRGIAFGAWIGSMFGGPLGAILGAALGHQIEKNVVSDKPRKGASAGRGRQGASSMQRDMVFCASAAAMMAKIAKADGRVSSEEIAEIEAAFVRLGFSREAREYAVKVFRRAKDDSHSVFEYAADFAAAIDYVEVREVFYEILWDIASADGVVSPGELEMLRRLPDALRIRRELFAYFSAERLGQAGRPRVDALEAAYTLLDASPSDTDEVLKSKYRALAKRNHPDVLRARGLPEEMVGKATEKMGRINDAWKTIREARGIK